MKVTLLIEWPGAAIMASSKTHSASRATLAIAAILLMVTSTSSSQQQQQQQQAQAVGAQVATKENSPTGQISDTNATTTTSTTTTTTTTTTTSKQNNSTTTVDTQPAQQQHRLSCQPGEQRQFSYESSTRVWGSSEQQVRLLAILRIKCMEPPTNTTLKYLAEVVSLTPNFVHGDQRDQQAAVSQKLVQAIKQATLASGGSSRHSKSQTFKAQSQVFPISVAASSQGGVEHPVNDGGAGQQRWVRPPVAANEQQQVFVQRRSDAVGREAQIDQMLRAEPLLEEVGEAATRMSRSLSGWFSKAWISVKDFFGNIFTSTERSSVSRDQAFRESGLDIMGQCKAPSSSSKGRNPAGLPFDESVFEDLGPEYYVGASLDGGGGGGGAGAFEFADSDNPDKPVSVGSGRQQQVSGAAGGDYHDDDDDDDMLTMSLSFFDDPAPPKSRNRRAASSSNQGRSAATGRSLQDNQSADYNRLVRIPFVFVQSRSGKIIEIRFSGDESDLSVKNFKRHLCDLFATNLDWTRTNQNEVSPIGKHQTKYQLDSSTNAIDSIKESVLRPSPGQDDEVERSNRQQLVKVLAMVGTSERNLFREGSSGQGNNNNTFVVYEDDEEAAGNDGARAKLEPDNRAQAEKSYELESESRRISVLRTINTTSGIQVSSKMLAPDIDRIQVRVKQVQQIDGGRLIGTAGQLSMSLVQQQQPTNNNNNARHKRETRDNQEESNDGQIEDISDLLKLSTSFSMQLVPIPRNPDGSIADESASPASSPTSADKSTARSASANRWRREASRKSPEMSPEPPVVGQKRLKKLAIVKRPPRDPQELQRVLTEWRKQEARLQLSASNLVTENNGPHESQLLRLEILRDQIKQRLNEEFVRNRIRRSLNEQQQQQQQQQQLVQAQQVRQQQQQPAEQLNQPSRSEPSASSSMGGSTRNKSDKSPAGGDLGLGLTQLVLGSGVTSKRKGSVYATIEEALELEAKLAEDDEEAAISRLLRETIRMDKLKQHCKSAIPTVAELTGSGGGAGGGGVGGGGGGQRYNPNMHIERRLPFGFSAADGHESVDEEPSAVTNELRQAEKRRSPKRRSLVERFERLNGRKLEQCQNVLQLMLELSDRRAIELIVDLIDDCNHRLVVAAKQEELGYGPVGKFYRAQRRRFIETLNHVAKPSDHLLDQLISRLYYPRVSLEHSSQNKQQAASDHRHRRPQQSRTSTPEPAEFVYIKKEQTRDPSTANKYNRSLLKDEDDFNNSDGAGLLVMSITSLAAKGSVSRSKRVEIAERLLQSLRTTSCSLFDSPDLDILESMASFQEPLDEIVGRMLALARRCKQYDQYVVAAIHGLSGQLQHAGAQRFLVDLLKSQNVSCTIKSEIVLVLIGAQLSNDLRQFSNVPLEPADSGGSSRWPNQGLNKVDEALLELVDSADKQREPDRRCLKQLVAHYMSKKHQSNTSNGSMSNQQAGGASASNTNNKQHVQRSNRSHQTEFGGGARSSSGGGGNRGKRAVVNEHNFWDEAQCKRWTMPADGQLDLGSIFSPHQANNQSHFSTFYSTHNTDLIDEIDDNSIITALMNNSHNGNGNNNKTTTTSSNARSGRHRNQKLIERELEPPQQGAGTSSVSAAATASQSSSGGGAKTGGRAFLRKRHKCMASKDFGPRNAQANLKAEIVNDLIGSTDENKFLARFRLATNFLGNRIDVGRMYLWHQRRTTRAYANILGRSIWDTSQSCKDKAPNQVLYMPLFDFNLWLIKVSVGLRLNAEMGFFSNCDQQPPAQPTVVNDTANQPAARISSSPPPQPPANDELQLYPTISLRAAGEASAKLVVARVGMSLASQYSYQGDIRVSRQPESCMSVYSAHQPMNITFSSWFQLWDNDCHFWGSRGRAEPQAIKWRLMSKKPTAWLEDECLASDGSKPVAPPAAGGGSNVTITPAAQDGALTSARMDAGRSLKPAPQPATKYP